MTRGMLWSGLWVIMVTAMAWAGDRPQVLMRYESRLYTAVAPVEKDPSADGLAATHAVPGRDSPGFLFRVHDPRPVPGVYELAARIKIARSPNPDAVVLRLGLLGGPLTDVRARGIASGKYVEVIGRWRQDQDMLNTLLLADWPGTVDLWLEKIEFRMVRAITDEELLPVSRRRSPVSRIKDGHLAVHFVRGLFSDKHYDALRAAGGNIRLSTSVITPKGVKGFPEGEALGKCDVVVLGDVSARSLSVKQRDQLARWVKSGGGMIILGGPFALGSGKYENSFLSPLLPVSPQGRGDIKKLDKPAAIALKGDRFKNLDWKAKPCFRFHHKVILRPTARVILAAGDIPVLVERPYGKGRVAVFCLTTQGVITGALPWWKWPDWGRLLIQQVKHAAGGVQ